MSKFNLKAIKARRLALGLSTKEMADRMGFCGHSVYWKYESGVQRLRADMLPRLAVALNCKISDFYT